MDEEQKKEDEFEDDDAMEEHLTNFGDYEKLPEGMYERIKKQAERTKQSMHEVTEEFFAYIKKHYDCDDPYAEDEDLLIDWSEGAFVTLARSSGGGDSQTWVGCFVGIADKKADRLEFIRKSQIRDFTKDPAQMLDTGKLGVYQSQNGKWIINTSQGDVVTDQPSDEIPTLGFKADDQYVCMLSKNGKPYNYIRMGRYAYFLGNELGKFVNEGSVELWRVDLTNDSVDMNIDIGRPCKFNARGARENAPEAYRDIVEVSNDFTITYTDDFVDEDVRPLLKPSIYWTNTEFHDLYVPLDDLIEAHSAKSRTFTGRDGKQATAGPLVITKGTVARLNSEPKDNEWDQLGFNYALSLTSTDVDYEVKGWVHGACGQQCAPFTAGWGEDKVEYAERSTVMVFGRLGLNLYEGKTYPRLNVLGVFADPRRIRQRASGGNTSVGQFGGDE